MNYYSITKNDMLNGDGLRVVLWVCLLYTSDAADE